MFRTGLKSIPAQYNHLAGFWCRNVRRNCGSSGIESTVVKWRLTGIESVPELAQLRLRFKPKSSRCVHCAGIGFRPVTDHKLDLIESV